MVRYLFYTIGDLTYQSPLVFCLMVRIFRLMLVFLDIYINSTNIPPIMIINRTYEIKKSPVAVACFLPGRAKDLSAPL